MDNIERLNEIKQRVIVAILADDEIGDRLVLKGGNLLQFAYGLTTRASNDVDVSVDGEFSDSAVLGDRVKVCLDRTFTEIGLVVLDFDFKEVPAKISEDLKTFWGGYKCEFKLLDRGKYELHAANLEMARRLAHPVGQQGSTRFHIDFSRHEFCEDKETFEIAGHTIFGYSPRMFVAEKLRALCQQMPEYANIVHRNRPAALRARDFLDIQVITEHYGIDFDEPGFHEVIQKTFAVKMVPLSWLGRIKDFRDFHEEDFVSVKETISPGFRLRDFDFYVDYVCARCEQLKPLWHE